MHPANSLGCRRRHTSHHAQGWDDLGQSPAYIPTEPGSTWLPDLPTRYCLIPTYLLCTVEPEAGQGGDDHVTTASARSCDTNNC
ncbi:hypothetical protein GQ602_000186 [Ophiocordyceps camponoti-floridani]|uniref:Uncharacterized protein n=1 Tax=Ophiocordyceps camponoti-floridani TaxID=2030778 RepID=A0A8H4QBQ3_9HYPO|nr:hypothetical protein GQ602_000186 [Ophiocordyceps camponoti-floridani]